MKPQITIRLARSSDQAAVLELIEKTGFFRPVELEIAREVFNDAAEMKPGCTYQSYVAEADGKAAGWICFGATPCTLGTFDIYWVAVDPVFQHKGVGTQLVQFTEKKAKMQHGRLLAVETSGTQRYEPTRKFYEGLGFIPAARVREFYAPGDDKCIYLKTLS